MHVCALQIKGKLEVGDWGGGKEERERKVKRREERGHKGRTNKNKDEEVCREECGAKGRRKK